MLEVVGVVVMKVVLLWSSDGDDVDRMLKEKITINAVQFWNPKLKSWKVIESNYF